MNTLIQLKKATPVFLVGLVLACFALPPRVQAVVPAPDGGYPGGNTAEGQNALHSLTTGGFNTAVGFLSLRSDTTGQLNTGVGAATLLNNTADENTATGTGALLSNTIGTLNTANGAFALLSNITGFQNTATGAQALYLNTIGNFNTANGISALYNNTTGGYNTANGGGALYLNTIGNFNTADGFEALHNNTIGFSNTANGYHALYSLSGGGNNTALGSSAGFNLTTGNNNIDIGNLGFPGESSAIRIGTEGTQTNTFIAGISGVTVAGGVGVIVDASGQLGTVVSSERFKDAIKPMDKASEAILSLQPVTFHYKKDLDPEGIPQFGLVAEDVEKVNPALVARDEHGRPYTVRYEAVNAMLLNEFLKEHRTVQEQGATIARLQKQIEALTAGLQKVSDQLEASKPAPQVVNNNP